MLTVLVPRRRYFRLNCLFAAGVLQRCQCVTRKSEEKGKLLPRVQKSRSVFNMVHRDDLVRCFEIARASVA